MADYILSCCSTADLTQEHFEQRDIRFICFHFEIDGKQYEDNALGDGQYDAFVKAMRKIYRERLGRTFPTLENYAVSIPPGGRTDALVQTVITWRSGEKILRTRGLDADQTEAAIKATIKMLNIVEQEQLQDSESK